MSFSYSELSSLLSNKRLRLDKSISLSDLADKFQRASREFPSLARLSRYSLEELILKGNGGAFDGKKEGISGKDIELKFLIEARKNSFRMDSNIREYSFNDEDLMMKISWLLGWMRGSFLICLIGRSEVWEST